MPAIAAARVGRFTILNELGAGGLGNRDEAFRWLERAVDERHPIAVFAEVEPDLDPLRPDPRFAALVTRARR